MWFSHTTRCIILLRLEVCTKVAAFECKNKMGSSHKLRSLAYAFGIFRLSPNCLLHFMRNLRAAQGPFRNKIVPCCFNTEASYDHTL